MGRVSPPWPKHAPLIGGIQRLEGAVESVARGARCQPAEGHYWQQRAGERRFHKDGLLGCPGPTAQQARVVQGLAAIRRQHGGGGKRPQERIDAKRSGSGRGQGRA